MPFLLPSPRTLPIRLKEDTVRMHERIKHYERSILRNA